MRISGLLLERQIYMISSCPPGYPDTQTRERCGRSDREDYTYLMDIPVSSLTTGQVYRSAQHCTDT